MYGSQSYLLISNEANLLRAKNLNEINLKQKNSQFTFLKAAQLSCFISILILATNVSFAGPKEPKLSGKNGNSTGRSN
jgi:hypothetical protein